jgi:MinD-like ATPase involved in chromosome partitioning or flagellar assembly
MLICCWSSKGGAGTTVVAAALARLSAALDGPGALLVDLGGDAGAVLGVPEPDSPGLAGWLRAGDGAPVDALGRLEVPVAPGLALLPRGGGSLPGERAAVLAAVLGGDPRQVVADCGTVDSEVAQAIAAAADRSILVTRPCFLALRRARSAAVSPTEVVLVTEPGRSITRHDVESALGAQVIATVPFDPAVARAVDAGLLATRLPRALSRELGRAV